MNKKASTFIAVISVMFILGGCASTPEKNLDKGSRESAMCVVPDNCAGGPTRVVQRAIDTIVDANFPERSGLYKAVMWKDAGQIFALTGLDPRIHISSSMYMALAWDQLVAVMAHELAHQEAHHSLISVGVSSAIWVIDKATWFITPWMILSPVDGLIYAAFERNQEMEADLMAVQYLENAGYSKDDYIDLLVGFKEIEGGGGCRVWCGHPYIEDRIQAVKEGRNVLHVEVNEKDFRTD
jgi:Zn-dependent protease with chaperone function